MSTEADFHDMFRVLLRSEWSKLSGVMVILSAIGSKVYRGIAKRAQLCYRCLAEGHQGKSCLNSRPYGKYLQKLHHRLLHQYDRQTGSMEPVAYARNHTERKRIDDVNLKKGIQIQLTSPRIKLLLSRMGRATTHSTTAMMAQNYPKTDFIVFRTVPVILNNSDRSLKFNAFLGEASTKTYVNAESVRT